MKVKILDSETLNEINQINLDLATRIESEYIVGRSPNSDLVLNGDDVSRNHGKFFLQDGNYYFCDLGSRNGSLVNGELAQTNQSYMLKAGDSVRIGDFVLIMEEISEEPEELPATVFRSFDPALLSGWRSSAKVATPEVANQAPEPVGEVPEVMAEAPEPVGEVPEVMAEAPEAVSEVPELVTGEVFEILTPAPEELREGSEVTSFQEVTFIQAPEEPEVSEVMAPPPEAVNEVSEEESEATDAIAPPAEAVSKASGQVETPEVDSQVTENDSEVSEETYVQTPLAAFDFDAIAQVPEEVSEATDAIAQMQAVGEASGEVEAPEAIGQVTDNVSEVSEVTIIQDLTIIQIPEAAESDVITPAPEEPEAAAVSEETISQAPEALRQVSQEEVEVFEVTSDTPPEAVSEVFEPVTQALEEETEATDAIAPPPEAVSEAPGEVEAPEVDSKVTNNVSEVPEVTDIQAPEEAEDFDAIAPTPEEPEAATVSEGTTVQAPELVSAVPELGTQTWEESAVSEDISQAPEEAEVSEVMAPPPEATSKAFEIISKKYIALMAHDSKKSELAQFVDQHKDFLSKCLTIATPSISETLYQQTGIAVSQKTPSVPVGGYQAVASLVGTGEMLAVIFLRDFMVTQSSQANEEALLRLCNINQVLLATNVPTAEAIMHYIKDMVASL